MKKNCFIALFLMAAAAFAQNSFGTKKFGTVDLGGNFKRVKSVEVKFFGMKANDFELFGADSSAQNWQKISSVSLKGFDDSEKIKIPSARRMQNLALVPVRDVEYQYVFFDDGDKLKISVRSKNDDLSAKPLPKISLENATVLEIDDFDAEDSVRFESRIDRKNLRFEIYAFSEHAYEWQKFGDAYLKNLDDTDSVSCKIDHADLDDFDYIAINPLQDGEFFYKLFARNNDLYVQVFARNSAGASQNLIPDDE